MGAHKFAANGALKVAVSVLNTDDSNGFFKWIKNGNGQAKWFLIRKKMRLATES